MPKLSFVRKALNSAATAFGGVFGVNVGALGVGPADFKPGETYGASTSAIAYDSAYLREKNPKLRTPKDRFNELDNIAANNIIAGMGIRLFGNLVSAATWSAKPPEELPAGRKAEAEKIAKLVDANVLHPTRGSWSEICSYQAADRFYDNRLMEWTADRRADGTFGIASIDPRPNSSIDRWIKDRNGVIAGVWQLVPGLGQYVWIPRGKLTYSADNALTTAVEGQGLLRNAYDTHQRLVRNLQLEGVGNENQLAGFLVTRAPVGEIRAKYSTLTEDQAKAKVAAEVQPLTSVIENHTVNPSRGIILDSALILDKNGTATTTPKWDVNAQRGDATGQAEVAKAIERDAFWLAILFSIEHLLIGHSRHGSYGAAEEKNGRLVDLVNAALRELARIFRRDVVLPIMRLNGWDEALCPELVPSDIQQLDVDLASNVLLRLAQAGEMIGAPTSDPVADQIRQRLGLQERPEPDPTAAAIKPATKPAGPDDPLQKPGNVGEGKAPKGAETPAARRRRGAQGG